MSRHERFVVVGLAHPRSTWFGNVARWATSAALPLEFLKVLSAEELRMRLGSGRPFSAVLVDGGVMGFDRDLVDTATSAGCAVLVVDAERSGRSWVDLGASATIEPDFDRIELLELLNTHATPIAKAEAAAVPSRETAAPAWRGRLVTVAGHGGAGASTVAMTIAQGLGADPRTAGLTLLADLALDADQAMLHDAGDVVPGVQELVEAHRTGDPSAEEVRGLAYELDGRGYSLLLGLRRHRDWAAIRPRAFAASLDGLRRAYKAVVADVTGDLEGESRCGSLDVEERNTMARTAVAEADAVVLVAEAGARGVHRLVRLVADALEHGVEPARIVPVVNRSPRNPRARAEVTAAVAELTGALTPAGEPVMPPVHLADRRRVLDAARDGGRLPSSMAAHLVGAVDVAIARAGGERAPSPAPEPELVAPGSLGFGREVVPLD